MGAYPINHGNETNMQAAYLFSYTSKPWHTQKWARAIQENIMEWVPETPIRETKIKVK